MVTRCIDLTDLLLGAVLRRAEDCVAGEVFILLSSMGGVGMPLSILGNDLYQGRLTGYGEGQYKIEVSWFDVLHWQSSKRKYIERCKGKVDGLGRGEQIDGK